MGASSSTSSTEGTAPPTPSGIAHLLVAARRARVAPRVPRQRREAARSPPGPRRSTARSGKICPGQAVRQAREPLEPGPLARDEVLGGEPQRLQVARARVVEGADGAEGERRLEAGVALAEGQPQRVAHQLGAGGGGERGRVVRRRSPRAAGRCRCRGRPAAPPPRPPGRAPRRRPPGPGRRRSGRRPRRSARPRRRPRGGPAGRRPGRPTRRGRRGPSARRPPGRGRGRRPGTGPAGGRRHRSSRRPPAAAPRTWPASPGGRPARPRAGAGSRGSPGSVAGGKMAAPRSRKRPRSSSAGRGSGRVRPRASIAPAEVPATRSKSSWARRPVSSSRARQHGRGEDPAHPAAVDGQRPDHAARSSRSPGATPARAPARHSTTARAPRAPATRQRGSGIHDPQGAPVAVEEGAADRRPQGGGVDARAGLQPEGLVRGQVGRPQEPDQARQGRGGAVAAGRDHAPGAVAQGARRARQAVDAQGPHRAPWCHGRASEGRC